MPKVSPATADFELARRLAEEFDAVPLPVVGRVVRAATQAARGIPAEIERLSRVELTAWTVVAARASAATG